MLNILNIRVKNVSVKILFLYFFLHKNISLNKNRNINLHKYNSFIIGMKFTDNTLNNSVFDTHLAFPTLLFFVIFFCKSFVLWNFTFFNKSLDNTMNSWFIITISKWNSF